MVDSIMDCQSPVLHFDGAADVGGHVVAYGESYPHDDVHDL